MLLPPAFLFFKAFRSLLQKKIGFSIRKPALFPETLFFFRAASFFRSMRLPVDPFFLLRRGYFYPELFSPQHFCSHFPFHGLFITGSVYLRYPLRCFFFRKLTTTGFKCADPKMSRPVFEIVGPHLPGVHLFLPSDRSWLDILSNIFAIGCPVSKLAFRLPENFSNLAIGSISRSAFVTFS